ncbi:MMPL family transporter [Pseudomonas sp. BGM005]|nr:MMPL family transporter [Pseudomonas sp. BG5]
MKNTTGAPKRYAISRIEQVAEHFLFGHRKLWLLFFAGISVVMAWQAGQIRPDASFAKMVPANHSFILNYLNFENELRPLANTVRIAVQVRQGDIYRHDYIELIKQITDEVFYIPGVDRGNLRSLTTANSLWMESTEKGLLSGRVVPVAFAGTADDLAAVRDNVLKAGLVGQLVGNNHASSVIMVPLLENDPDTGERLDYGLLSQRLEKLVRNKYGSADIEIHIVGFAKLIGDLIKGAEDIGLFFLITIILTTALVYLYSRCWCTTLSTIGCCLLAVVWHLGTMHMLGFGLDPYSVLVPFLTFAIGVSHAMQNVNTLASHSLRGESRIEAAKATFRLLFVPGTVALLCNVAGFSTMLVIDIGVIREMAISASVGVAVIIFTKMFLLPVLMSYTGLSANGLKHALARSQGSHRLQRGLSRLTEPRVAACAVAIAAGVSVWAFAVSRDLQIGDLEPGAPELRPNSVYNLDTRYVTQNYSTSSDVFVAMVKTKPGECASYPVASTVTRLQWALEETPGVQSTTSLFNVQRQVIAGRNGGNEKWATTTRNRYVANGAHSSIPQSLYNDDCSMLPVIAYLTDHRAGTLDAVVATVKRFVSENANADTEILLAAGNAGIEAATNEVVHAAWVPMLLLVYGIVSLLVLLEFRSFKVTLCVIVPLLTSSLLCEAIMTRLGLGVKVATLPVITLGVGIGVDYGIYLYNRLESYLAKGVSLKQAYFQTMCSTGLAIAFTGVTLSVGVAAWVFSDIKFQADMGLLLAFMFLWNMIGAIVLIPALATVLRVRSTRRIGREVLSADLQATPLPTASGAHAELSDHV